MAPRNRLAPTLDPTKVESTPTTQVNPTLPGVSVIVSGAAYEAAASAAAAAASETNAGNSAAGAAASETNAADSAAAAADSETNAAGSAAAAAASATALANAKLLWAFDTRALAIAANIPLTVGQVFLAGYTSSGDGGGGLYARVGAQPSHNGKFQSADGAWWELRPHAGIIVPEQFGARSSTTSAAAVALGVASTVAMQSAFDYASAKNCQVMLLGWYLIAHVLLREKAHIKGVGEVRCGFVAVAGITGTWINSEDTETDDVHLEEFSIDHRWPAAVSSGDTLAVYGSRQTLTHITVINSAGTGIHTRYVLNDRLHSILGHYSHITVDKAAVTNWKHEGPTDSFMSHVELVDGSLGAENGGYGLWLTGPTSMVRAFNLHIWNRTPTPNNYNTTAGLMCEASGCAFVGCHFESGGTNVYVTGAYNMFDECSFYSPDGPTCMVLAGDCNRVTGLVGGGADELRPNYAGIILGESAGNPSGYNYINVMDGGAKLGSIDFTHSAGHNTVRVRGDKAAGHVNYIGTPQPTDDVIIETGNAGGVYFVQDPTRNKAWTEVAAPAPTSGGGSGLVATATWRYLIDGKTVHAQLEIGVTTISTASGFINVDVPAAIIPNKRVTMTGVEHAVNGKQVTGRILASGGTCAVAADQFAFAGAPGAVIVLNASWPIA